MIDYTEANAAIKKCYEDVKANRKPDFVAIGHAYGFIFKHDERFADGPLSHALNVIYGGELHDCGATDEDMDAAAAAARTHF